MYQNPQHRSSTLRIFLSKVATIAIISIIFCSCAKQNSTSIQSPVDPANKSTSNAGTPRAKYFEGNKACKFLSNIRGMDLGNYVPLEHTDGYSCSVEEPIIDLSCNPSVNMLCNQITYNVGGEKEGATSAQLSYMGYSQSSEAHKKDVPIFIQHSNQLAQQALGGGNRF